jgi:anaerobic selenocysteine-containing dehydrogenase
MKLSRRCFLAFSIGGAAGTALSPLPWKLTDDLSIWSQNWPWTPVPPDGEYGYIDTTCTLCPGHCGIRVRKVDERAVKIEGQESSGMNPGGICLLGLSGLQLLYGPTRVQGPLKRVGERGENRWQTISWKEAIDEVAGRLNELRTKGQPQAVAALASDDTGTVPQLMKRLLTAVGSPNFYRMPSMEDTNSAGLALMQGHDGFVGLDVEQADFVLSFGSALLDGYGASPRMMQAVNQLRAAGGKLAQIDSRLSNTAAKSDIWLAPQPGTEAEVALAIAHVLIAKNRYDHEYMSQWTEGFEAFAAMVAEKYAPEKVAERTGLEADSIIRTAMAFADAERPLAVYGRGKGQLPGSLKEALAVNALNALAGNINRPGGIRTMAGYDYIQWPALMADDIAASGLQNSRLDQVGDVVYPNPGYKLHRVFEAVSSGNADLQALLVTESNPCFSLPDAAKVQAAFSKIPFVVSFSSFMDETAMQSDLILPNHIYLERYEDVPVKAGATRHRVGLCRPVVAPLYNTQHVGDSIIQIAHAMKGPVAASFPWSDYASCLKETLADAWETMVEKGYWEVTETPETAGAEGFEAASGQFVLMNETIGAIYLADSPLPAGDENQYLLQLVAYDTIRLSSHYAASSPFMIKTLADTTLKGQAGFVDVNPETAAQLNLKEGQTATITTPVASAEVRVHLDQGVRPGIVAMARGLGHTAYDGFLAGKGVNVNQLIAPVEDPASGLDAAWGIRAKLASV